MLLKISFQNEDFSDEEIEIFQDLIDEWFNEYIELVCLSGVTNNYLHLLGAGNLFHYIKKWGNLYRYQQQGWEMKNGMISALLTGILGEEVPAESMVMHTHHA